MTNTHQRSSRNTIHLLLIILLAMSPPSILAQQADSTDSTDSVDGNESDITHLPEQGQDQAQGQEQDQDQSQRPVVQQQGQRAATERVITIEEITVTAERSFFLLRAQIETAERALYSTYNDLNENDDLDVVCETRARPGYAHIRQQQCWPKFFIELVAENSQNSMFLNQNSFVIPPQQLANQYKDELDAVKTNMLMLANEHPSVAEAIMNMGRLEQALRDKQEECRQQPAVLGLLRYCP